MIRKAPVVAFVCLAGLSLFAGYNYQSVLTVSGYSGASTLSGFPVLVRISPDGISGFSYDKLTDPDNGTDIRFLDNVGNVLPQESTRGTRRAPRSSGYASPRSPARPRRSASSSVLRTR